MRRDPPGSTSYTVEMTILRPPATAAVLVLLAVACGADDSVDTSVSTTAAPESSPNASATLLIAAITRIAPTTLTWRWNGAYALVCYLVFTVAFWALAG